MNRTNRLASSLEEEQFINAIKDNPNDYNYIYAYVDYLEESGSYKGEVLRIIMAMENDSSHDLNLISRLKEIYKGSSRDIYDKLYNDISFVMSWDIAWRVVHFDDMLRLRIFNKLIRFGIPHSHLTVPREDVQRVYIDIHTDIFDYLYRGEISDLIQTYKFGKLDVVDTFGYPHKFYYVDFYVKGSYPKD